MTAPNKEFEPPVRVDSTPCVVSILIVNWNAVAFLKQCLDSVLAHPPASPFEVIVFDNASTDGSVDRLAPFYTQVRWLTSETNLGFAAANNRAASLAKGTYWLLLNPDTLMSAGTIDRLVTYLEARPRVGAAGPRLLNSDGSLQPSIERLPSLFREWWRLFHLDRLYPISSYPRTTLASSAPRAVEVLNGACLLVRRAALPPPGLFDEDYFVYSEEIDLCDRMRQAGQSLHWVPEVSITHFGGRSTHQAADAMFLQLYGNKVRFFRKRRGPLTAHLYKHIVLLAASTRVALGLMVWRLPVRQAERWRTLTRQYMRLLAALPAL